MTELHSNHHQRASLEAESALGDAAAGHDEANAQKLYDAIIEATPSEESGVVPDAARAASVLNASTQEASVIDEEVPHPLFHISTITLLSALAGMIVIGLTLYFVIESASKWRMRRKLGGAAGGRKGSAETLERNESPGIEEL